MPGRVRADGSEVTVDFSRTPSLAGSGTRPLVRPLAHALDEHGLTVRVTGPSGTLLRLGHGVRAPWWQVPATSSRRIQVTSVPLALRSLMFKTARNLGAPGFDYDHGWGAVDTAALISARTSASEAPVGSTPPRAPPTSQ